MKQPVSLLRIVMLWLVVAGAPVLLNGVRASAQTSCKPADNTAQNKGDGMTADHQSNAKDDRMTTANVRKALMADKDLSTYAHNVKIITKNGTVTLKGPVKSDDEKQRVAADAATVVSQDKVDNQLTVKQ